jgi:hypothetical protein
MEQTLLQSAEEERASESHGQEQEDIATNTACRNMQLQPRNGSRTRATRSKIKCKTTNASLFQRRDAT